VDRSGSRQLLDSRIESPLFHLLLLRTKSLTLGNGCVLTSSSGPSGGASVCFVVVFLTGLCMQVLLKRGPSNLNLISVGKTAADGRKDVTAGGINVRTTC